jgi:hypothetical protein
MRVSAALALLPLTLAAPQKRAPLHIPRDVQLIEDHYIVKLKAPEGEFRATVDALVADIAADADLVYENFGGFAASLTAKEVEALRSNPNVSTLARTCDGYHE